MKYSVVIVNYNGERILKSCLESVYASEVKPVEVIIYDNCSSDGSKKIIREDYPKVILLEGKKNLGFGNANNIALQKASGEFILFLNNDVILDKMCVKELLNGFKNKKIAIVNPLIYKGWEKKKNQEIYSFGAELNRSGFAYSLYDEKNDRSDLNCFSGACFMARRQLIKAISFEKHFFLYYEEPALSIGVLSNGYKIARVEKAVCYHLENFSSPKNKDEGICFRQYYAIQNRWYLLGKYWPAYNLILALPLNLLHLFFNLYFFAKAKKFRSLRLSYIVFRQLYLGRKAFNNTKKNIWFGQLVPNNFWASFALRKKVYK